MLCCIFAVGVITQSKAESSGWIDGKTYLSLDCDSTDEHCLERNDLRPTNAGGRLQLNYAPYGGDSGDSVNYKNIMSITDTLEGTDYPLFNYRLDARHTTYAYSYFGVEGADELILKVNDTDSQQIHLFVIKDILDSLVKYIDSNGVVTYTIDTTKGYEIGINGHYIDLTASADGRYLFVAHESSSGFPLTQKIDLLTHNSVNVYTSDVYKFAPSGASSQDGRYLLTHEAIYDTATCGTPIDCQSIKFKDIVENYLGTNEHYTHFIEPASFYGNDRKIHFIASRSTTLDYPSMDSHYTLSLDYSLDYLALGDSFSSGEGDLTENGNGYQAGTNITGTSQRPTEKCHISTSSYPHLLSGRYLYTRLSWGSVACSGAKIFDIEGANNNTYQGQDSNDTPRLKGYDVTSLKSKALNELIPGRQKQVEFIKKYQPKAVTISVGGNDVAFGKILLACASPDMFNGGEWTTTCSYAKDKGTKSDLLISIFNLTSKLTNLYTELREAGPPGMKTYVIGYPIFVDPSASDYQCGWGAQVRLNKDEREMIVASTKLLNNIARFAAEQAGAVYVSTETSLGSHTLCGASDNKAVNGIIDGGAAESFHPNQLGQKLMADRIEEAINHSHLDWYRCQDGAYITCPGGEIAPVSIPSFFEYAATHSSGKSVNDHSMLRDVLLAPGKVLFKVFDYTYGANSPIAVLLYSEKHELGTYRADSNGGFNEEITLPANTPPGYHTIVLEGTDPNGEPLRTWKIVYIDNPGYTESTTDTQHTDKNDAKKGSIENKNSTSSLLHAPQSEGLASGSVAFLPQSTDGNDLNETATDTLLKNSKHPQQINEESTDLRQLYFIGISLMFAILTIWLLLHAKNKKNP